VAGTERDRITHITHGDLALHNPVAPARLDETLAQLGVAAGERALDVGCGQGEVLIRLAERHGLTGTGVDSSAPAIDAARERAAERVPGAGLAFVCDDAGAIEPGPGFAVGVCIGSSHALGGLHATIAYLRERVRPGGWILIGDGYWRTDPDDAYLAALGGATKDELPELDGLVAAGTDAGLRAVWLATSTEEDWERYEWSLIANGERWAADHPDDPLTAPLLAWVDQAKARVLLPGGLSTLGFALVLLRVP
jgi:SAM-dependent methyltransferase